jgi:hypothetical protein
MNLLSNVWEKQEFFVDLYRLMTNLIDWQTAKKPIFDKIEIGFLSFSFIFLLL